MDAITRQYVDRSRQWQAAFQGLLERIGPRFGRGDTRLRVEDYLRGLLSPAERKNAWQLSQAVARPRPYGMQHLLDRACWDADAVRDEIQAYVSAHLGSPDAVLVIDETGFLKKGQHSVGVQRQYSGTAGRIENCQIGVFLAYASPRGRALVDRALFLPRSWAEDAPRRAAAKVPAVARFATKPELARRMLERALAAQLPFAWVTADKVYGDHRGLRVWLEQQEIHFVLALACNQHLWTLDEVQQRATQLAATLQKQDWVPLSAGDGTKGPRLYDWARVPLWSWQMPGERWLLRRSRTDGQLAYYVCTRRAVRTCSSWSWSLDGAGRWKSASKRPRERWAWITMKCAAGTTGTGTSPWPWPPMRTWPYCVPPSWPRPRSKKAPRPASTGRLGPAATDRTGSP